MASASEVATQLASSDRRTSIPIEAGPSVTRSRRSESNSRWRSPYQYGRVEWVCIDAC
jgi:hypothetical protein